MTKYPFTAEGFQALQKNLYELPQSALQLQADELRIDFRNWMISNFLLEPSQTAYLANLSEKTVAFAATATSYAVENRLPVILRKKDRPERMGVAQTQNDPEEIFKILDVENQTSITEGEEGPVAGGDVIINIDFIASTGRQ